MNLIKGLEWFYDEGIFGKYKWVSKGLKCFYFLHLFLQIIYLFLVYYGGYTPVVSYTRVIFFILIDTLNILVIYYKEKQYMKNITLVEYRDIKIKEVLR